MFLSTYIKVGGCDDLGCLNSAEVFDCRTQVWRMISSMSTSRYKFGIGVLDKILYAVSLSVIRRR